MDNKIINSSFRAALGQFAEASYSLVRETGKLPFFGGWKRLVILGPPVLLLASGTGALIFTIMLRSTRAIGNMLYSNVNNSYKKFYNSTKVVHNKPTFPAWPPSGIDNDVMPRSPQTSQNLVQLNSPLTTPLLAPLPIDAAKERNESLLKLLGLIENFVIEPLIQKQDLSFGMGYTPDQLKDWLKCMTLWQLGIAWEQLENEYVKMKTPPPPTLASIVTEAKQIDAKIGEVFQTILLPNEIDNIKSETTAVLLGAITTSPLTQTQKMELSGLCFKLDHILKKAPEGIDVKIAEEQEIRKKFALTMHHGMANTLTHMAGIIEGWIASLTKTSSAVAPKEFKNEAPHPEAAPNENQTARLVKEVSGKVQKEITEKYLMPLWNKKYREWNSSVEKDLKKGCADKEIAFVEKFMNGEIDEKSFLKSKDSFHISTSLASDVFFIRALRYMGSNPDILGKSTLSIVDSLLAQLQPTLIDTLTKSIDMVAQISFERTVPKVVGYFIELLKCCTTMQKVRESSSTSKSFDDNEDLQPSLGRAGMVTEESQHITKLYQETPSQISGKGIIDSFPEGSIHKVVLRSFESSVHETTWIRTKKEQLKGILHLRAEQYVKQEENWLSNLFKTNSTGKSTNLVGMLLAYSNKLREIPGIEAVVMSLFSGVEAVLENKGCDATQAFLNKLTSTGYLSTKIATSLVKGLLAKEEAEWKKNLPILQQAYLFLQPEEQKLVLKHLAVICDANSLERRTAELENSKGIPKERIPQIEGMKKRENDYKGAQERLLIAMKDGVLESDKKDIPLLAKAFKKLKREKELQQFERMRTLVIYVVDNFLKDIFTFTGGEALKDICIKVLNEALTLLTCQEIIKHWIFTLVDLVIDELEEGGNSKSNTQDLSLSQTPITLLDLIEGNQKKQLLQSLTDFMVATEKDGSWLSMRAWAVWSADKVSNWSPNTIWGYITPYREKTTITPVQLKDKIIKWLSEFGKKPNGLSELIIQALTEHVADPRSV